MIPNKERIALVTSQAHPALTEDDQLIVAPLRDLGFDVQAEVWDSKSARWGEYDCCIIRSTWDYHVRSQEFQAWLRSLSRQGVTLLNPVDVLLWNMHKGYLGELATKGIQVIETHLVKKGEDRDFAPAFAMNMQGDVVIKPAVSATAHQTYRIRRGELDRHRDKMNSILERTDVLVQPFVEDVQSVGEWSFIFFGETFSHAVLKKPRDGDYRSQSEFGGQIVSITPTSDMIDEASSVVQTMTSSLLYARVDAIPVDGHLAIVEFEVLEPALFFQNDSAAAGRFARRLWELMKA